MGKNFVFGYGSLINKESRDKSATSGKAIPATVRGIRRGWIVPMAEHKASGAGIVRQEKGICNGVIFPVTATELAGFDEREFKAGYERIRVNLDAIPVDQEFSSKGIIWAYVSNHPQHPSENAPVIQSYVDVILAGCLSFGKKFAREFIQTTDGWEGPWENDRAVPRYVRPMARNASLENKIDELLAEEIPKYFARRK